MRLQKVVTPLFWLLLSLGLSISAYGARPRIQGSFHRHLEDALEDVKSILDTTRHPVIASDDRDHSYDDKYALVETVTNSMLASVKNVFDQFGVDFRTALDWVKNEKRSVKLQFTMVRKARYVKQELRRLEALLNGGVTYDHTFQLDASYKLELVKGGGQKTILLQSRDDMSETTTVSGGNGKVPPNVYRNSTDQASLDLTWMLEQFDFDSDAERVGKANFAIDRLSEKCKTPRRNPEVENAESAFAQKLINWGERVSQLLTEDCDDSYSVREHLQKHSKMIFPPVLPLFENHTALGNATVKNFIHKHESSLEDTLTMVSDYFNRQEDFLSGKEAGLALLAMQLSVLAQFWSGSVDTVEEMLYAQLEEAVGKHLGAEDFEEFIDYHAREVLDAEFAPKPFVYPIRRGKQYPDGMLSLEGSDRTTWGERTHIQTTVRTLPGGTGTPVQIPLTPATSVEILGDRLLHGWLQNQWAGEYPMLKTFLVARAHQFSSFLLVVGQMRGTSDFVPKQALIVQNKDEVLIPLISSVLPSAKEFKDSIASLSPEQKEFAKAFREMQLGSSVLGVCVIQIKPQLERLLELPDGALTKEIKLTQDLMDLFVKHQIPSDLLSYDGDSQAPVAEKIGTVRGYVKAVADVIDDLIAKQVKDEKLKKEIYEAQHYDDITDTKSDGGGSWGMDSLYSDYSGMPPLQMNERVRRSGRRSQKQRGHPQMAKMASSGVYHASSADFSSSSPRAKPRQSPPATPDVSTPDVSIQKESVRDHPDHAVWSKEQGSVKAESNEEMKDNIDFSRIPKILDARIEKEDKDGALKSTIIRPGSEFHRSRHASIIQDAVKSTLVESTVQDEKNRAMDLLTAISRSGSLPIEASEVHVIVGMTHSFPKQIVETIIEDNVNPIEKVEKSLRMIASVIHGKPGEADLSSTKTAQ